MRPLIGREEQKRLLLSALNSNKPELIALIGRRRVGKTFLVRQTYEKRIRFELTGLQTGGLREQLQNFALTFARAFPDFDTSGVPENWLVAFDQLARALEAATGPERPVIFLDELPWLATRRSGFLRALGYFWNSWASKQSVVVVICGSAASWMIDKVVNDKGGLHNRITRLLHLDPFTLHETELLCKAQGVRLPRYQLLQLYMVMGGIPMYLEQLEQGLSAAQQIQAICFARNGYLRREFNRLFASLFADYERHVTVIRALAEKRIGMPRKVLASLLPQADGGSLNRTLDELIESGFVTVYSSYRKRRRDQLYRLTDPYSLFYLTYIERLGQSNGANFTQLSSLPAWRSWSGYAFETVCLQHVPQIKRALGIAGIATIAGSFYTPATDAGPGAQIDLLIERADQTIHLCEAKFTQRALRLTTQLQQQFEQKSTVFHRETATPHHLFHTLITTHPPSGTPAQYNIDQVITLDDLFAA